MSKKKLMLVESPHKAKVITGFLDNSWKVIATVGSMFDIENPTTEAKKKKYDAHGIDTKTWDRNLKVSNSKQFNEIKKLVKSGVYNEIYLSTDPDRAGAQIAQDVIDNLATEIKKQNIAVHRATWNEITKKAVNEGLANKSKNNQNEVNAANARQIYDRLFGFTISPVLWKTVHRGASGGRVQSPALRLIVNRENERLAFIKADYMSVNGVFSFGKDSIIAKLITFGNKKIASGSSFDSDGKIKNEDVVITPDTWKKLEPILKSSEFAVSSVDSKPYSRKPPMPYTTSSFQQDVGTRLSLSSKQSMSIAQMLYDSSFVTYIRTDSPSLSDEGTKAARNSAIKLYGKDSVPNVAREYKSKSKNAQEGHEALRPTCDDNGNFRDPKTIKAQLDKLDSKAFAVYTAIYNRTVASQMNDAKGITTTVKISSTNTSEKHTSIFSTSATVFTELGWTALTKPISKNEEENNSLDVTVEKGMKTELLELSAKNHTTMPPARYTEPQLVSKLEELGIGRPSTYASIVTVNQTRGYVKKKGQQLFPTWTGMKVARYLEAKIPGFVSFDATEEMENNLDNIETGSLKMSDFLKKEWAAIKKDVATLGENIDWDEVNEISRIDLHNGYQVRVNSFGHWLEDTSVPVDKDGKRKGVKLSDDENVAEIDFSDPLECKKLFEAGSNKVEAQELGVLETGPYKNWIVTAKDGKYGPFVQAVNPNAKSKDKPINHSLPEGIELETIKFNDIKHLFNEIKLPRTLSPNFFVGRGKKGNYIGFKKSAKTRRAEFKSLPDSFDPRTVTLDEVKTIWEESGQK